MSLCPSLIPKSSAMTSCGSGGTAARVWTASGRPSRTSRGRLAPGLRRNSFHALATTRLRATPREYEPVLARVWVAGPGSARPGELLASPAGPAALDREAAQALALDLSRRSTTAPVSATAAAEATGPVTAAAVLRESQAALNVTRGVRLPNASDQRHGRPLPGTPAINTKAGTCGGASPQCNLGRL